MSKQGVDSQRIIKNAALLYVRMLLTMGVSFYTSRVILETLGFEDFGIYNVVGGVVVLFSFFNSSMGSATSRFLTYAIGKKDQAEICQTYSTAIYIHIVLALAILFLSETVGLWFLESKLVIPPSKMMAARIVYQLSILTTLVAIMRVPFDALIIAYEKFNFFAKIEIVNAFLRLGIVFLIVYLPFEKLILYASLILLITVIIAFSYALYVYVNFKDIRFAKAINSKQLKQMLTFSSWDLYGNMSVMLRTQGVNMLLNMFFGAIVNAAAGISMQVQSAVMSFSGNVLTAFRPQIVKQYSLGNYTYMSELIFNACKYSVILLFLIGIPIIFNIEYVLTIWLKNVPAYTVPFCIWTLIFNLGASLSSGIIAGIHATGNIKRPSLINGTLYLLVVPVSYLLFKSDFPPYYSFVFNACAVFLGCFSNVYTLSLYIPEFSKQSFLTKVLCPLSLLLLVVTGLLSGLRYFVKDDLIYLLSSALMAILSISLFSYLFIIDEDVRSLIRKKISFKYE